MAHSPSFTRRRFLGATLAAAALGAVACSRAPSPSATVAAAAATAAAQSPAARPAAPDAASPTPAGPTATPTLVPPRPTVTPLPPTPTPTPVVRGTPQTFEIPKIGVSAPVVAVKTSPDGALGSPDRPDVVGWFVGGPRPGDPGNALITGHRDFANNGHPVTAVFWDLGKLGPGDQIVVTTDRGESLPFQVESTNLYDRANAPVDQILGYQIGRVVTIISCEGTFIPAERDYTERRIVRARLAMPV
jgi:sortase (surface protein transpeptidase)